MIKKRLTLACLAMLLAGKTSAATEKPADSTASAVIADELVVTGRKGDMLQQVTGTESKLLNPSQMSVYRVINMVPSLNQMSVDPYGLADISNYHESFRFRGVEATAGGVPSTTVNVEHLPVTGRPGGGASIFDLENFSNINIYTGGIPANRGFGLANVGGKIDMEILRPSETAGLTLKQGFGSSDYFSRTFMRLDTGELTEGVRSFVSFSHSDTDKWKGEGGSERNNFMAGVSGEASERVKLEAFLTYSRTEMNTYRPLTYAQVEDFDENHDLDYGTDPGDYWYYGYNRNSFEDWMLLGNLEIRTGEESLLNVRPYYWSDKGYYLETITQSNAQNRIRRWDMEHDLKGILASYATTLGDVDIEAGYHYHSQERPGPPTSWKVYRVEDNGPVFDRWGILSNTSSHEMHAPYVVAKYRHGSFDIEGGMKYVRYTLPSIITYQTTGIGDVDYDEAIRSDPETDAFASAPDKKSFARLFPNLTLRASLLDGWSAHLSYGENYVTHVDIYPYFIAQRALFTNAGVSFQDLWDDREMEISRNLELGMQFSGDNWKIVPTVYYASHRNKQANLYDPEIGAYYPQNDADAEAWGVELEAECEPFDRLSLYGSFSWNRFYFTQDVFTESGTLIDVDGEQVPDAPEFLIRALASYRIGDVTLSPVIRYTSDRYGDILHKEKVDGATLVDFDVTWRTRMLGAKQADLSLSFLNVFDTKYVSIISASDYKTLKTAYQPGMPFTLVASVSLHY